MLGEEAFKRRVKIYATDIDEDADPTPAWLARGSDARVLLDRPDFLKSAIEVANERKNNMAITMDKDPMYGYVAECLRFMPVQPGVFRFVEQQQTLTGTGQGAEVIAARGSVAISL